MVSARWGGVRTDPYNPNPKDADLDGIVQEGTFFERPVGTKFISGAMELVSGAQGNNLEDIRGLLLVDEDGNPVDYTPTWRGMRLSVGQRHASIGQRTTPIGERGTVTSGPQMRDTVDVPDVDPNVVDVRARDDVLDTLRQPGETFRERLDRLETTPLTRLNNSELDDNIEQLEAILVQTANVDEFIDAEDKLEALRKERVRRFQEVRQGRATRSTLDADAGRILPEDIRREVDSYDWVDRRVELDEKKQRTVEGVIGTFWSGRDDPDEPWDLVNAEALEGFYRDMYPDLSDEDIDAQVQFILDKNKSGEINGSMVFQMVLNEEAQQEYINNMFLVGKRIDLGMVEGSDGKKYRVVVTPELEDQPIDDAYVFASGRFNYEIYDEADNLVGEYTPSFFGSHSDSGFTRGIDLSGITPELHNEELGANAIVKLNLPDEDGNEISVDTRGMGLAEIFNANTFLFANGLGIEEARLGSADDGSVVWPRKGYHSEVPTEVTATIERVSNILDLYDEYQKRRRDGIPVNPEIPSDRELVMAAAVVGDDERANRLRLMLDPVSQLPENGLDQFGEFDEDFLQELGLEFADIPQLGDFLLALDPSDSSKRNTMAYAAFNDGLKGERQDRLLAGVADDLKEDFPELERAFAGGASPNAVLGLEEIFSGGKMDLKPFSGKKISKEKRSGRATRATEIQNEMETAFNEAASGEQLDRALDAAQRANNNLPRKAEEVLESRRPPVGSSIANDLTLPADMTPSEAASLEEAVDIISSVIDVPPPRAGQDRHLVITHANQLEDKALVTMPIVFNGEEMGVAELFRNGTLEGGPAQYRAIRRGEAVLSPEEKDFISEGTMEWFSSGNVHGMYFDPTQASDGVIFLASEDRGSRKKYVSDELLGEIVLEDGRVASIGEVRDFIHEYVHRTDTNEVGGFLTEDLEARTSEAIDPGLRKSIDAAVRNGDMAEAVRLFQNSNQYKLVQDRMVASGISPDKVAEMSDPRRDGYNPAVTNVFSYREMLENPNIDLNPQEEALVMLLLEASESRSQISLNGLVQSRNIEVQSEDRNYLSSGVEVLARVKSQYIAFAALKQSGVDPEDHEDLTERIYRVATLSRIADPTPEELAEFAALREEIEFLWMDANENLTTEQFNNLMIYTSYSSDFRQFTTEEMLFLEPSMEEYLRASGAMPDAEADALRSVDIDVDADGIRTGPATRGPPPPPPFNISEVEDISSPPPPPPPPRLERDVTPPPPGYSGARTPPPARVPDADRRPSPPPPPRVEREIPAPPPFERPDPDAGKLTRRQERLSNLGFEFNESKVPVPGSQSSNRRKNTLNSSYGSNVGKTSSAYAPSAELGDSDNWLPETEYFDEMGPLLPDPVRFSQLVEAENIRDNDGREGLVPAVFGDPSTPLVDYGFRDRISVGASENPSLEDIGKWTDSEIENLLVALEWNVPSEGEKGNVFGRSDLDRYLDLTPEEHEEFTNDIRDLLFWKNREPNDPAGLNPRYRRSLRESGKEPYRNNPGNVADDWANDLRLMNRTDEVAKRKNTRDRLTREIFEGVEQIEDDSLPRMYAPRTGRATRSDAPERAREGSPEPLKKIRGRANEVGTAKEQKARKVLIGENSSLYESFGGVDGEEVEADLLELVFEGAMVDQNPESLVAAYLVSEGLIDPDSTDRIPDIDDVIDEIMTDHDLNNLSEETVIATGKAIVEESRNKNPVVVYRRGRTWDNDQLVSTSGDFSVSSGGAFVGSDTEFGEEVEAFVLEPGDILIDLSMATSDGEVERIVKGDVLRERSIGVVDSPVDLDARTGRATRSDDAIEELWATLPEGKRRSSGGSYVGNRANVLKGEIGGRNNAGRAKDSTKQKEMFTKGDEGATALVESSTNIDSFGEAVDEAVDMPILEMMFEAEFLRSPEAIESSLSTPGSNLNQVVERSAASSDIYLRSKVKQKSASSMGEKLSEKVSKEELSILDLDSQELFDKHGIDIPDTIVDGPDETPLARFVSTMHSDWANDSQQPLIQVAAAKRAGLSDDEIMEKVFWNDLGYKPEDTRAALKDLGDGKTVTLHGKVISPESLALTEKWLDTESETLAENLKEQGVTHVTLFRGVTPDTYDNPSDMVDGSSPLTSWAYSFEPAALFAGGEDEDAATMLEASVPIEALTSASFLGFGCLHEDEVIVDSSKINPDLVSFRSVAEVEEIKEALSLGRLKEIRGEMRDPGHSTFGSMGLRSTVGAILEEKDPSEISDAAKAFKMIVDELGYTRKTLLDEVERSGELPDELKEFVADFVS